MTYSHIMDDFVENYILLQQRKQHFHFVWSLFWNFYITDPATRMEDMSFLISDVRVAVFFEKVNNLDEGGLKFDETFCASSL